MVPELLGLMSQLAARYVPDENGHVSTSLPALTTTQQALFSAATRLLPGAALPHSQTQTPDEAMAAAHAAAMPYTGDVQNGQCLQHAHLSANMCCKTFCEGTIILQNPVLAPAVFSLQVYDWATAYHNGHICCLGHPRTSS